MWVGSVRDMIYVRIQDIRPPFTFLTSQPLSSLLYAEQPNVRL